MYNVAENIFHYYHFFPNALNFNGLVKKPPHSIKFQLLSILRWNVITQSFFYTKVNTKFIKACNESLGTKVNTKFVKAYNKSLGVLPSSCSRPREPPRRKDQFVWSLHLQHSHSSDSILLDTNTIFLIFPKLLYYCSLLAMWHIPYKQYNPALWLMSNEWRGSYKSAMAFDNQVDSSNNCKMLFRW